MMNITISKKTRENVNDMLRIQRNAYTNANRKMNMFGMAHSELGADMTKPFTVVGGFGKFTINSVIKALNKEMVDFDDNMDILLFIVLPLYTVTTDRVKAVRLSSDGTMDIMKENANRHGGAFSIGHYYRVADFNSDRQDGNIFWFAITQNTQYRSATVTGCGYIDAKFDINDRFKTSNGFYGKTRYSDVKFEQNGNTFGYQLRMNGTSTIEVDKSGYIMNHRRKSLQNRLANYKAEKRRAEALAYVATRDISDIEDKVAELRTRIADYILSGGYMDMASIGRTYQYLVAKLNEYKTANYRTVDMANYAIETMQGYIKSIDEFLEVEESNIA